MGGGGGGSRWVAPLLNMNILHSFRAQIGVAGQDLAARRVIFTVLDGQRVIFVGQKCRHTPNTEHEAATTSMVACMLEADWFQHGNSGYKL